MAERTLIMGVLNVTPDSFSDGGRYFDSPAAIEHGMRLAEEGADIIDIGGESTRPGAERVSPEEEQMRVVPVIAALARNGVKVSIDTMNAATAILAVENGASYVNDVSGGLADFFMARAVAATGATFIASHWRGQSATMDQQAIYKDAPSDITRELKQRVDALLAEGISPDKLILDPGLGFAKSEAHNWQMLGRLGELMSLGYPLLVGASRKRFLTALLPDDASIEERDNASVAVSVLAANSGAWGVRVHDVARTHAALRVLASWNRGAERPDASVEGGFLEVRQEARARSEALAEQIHDLTFDFDAELAISRELAVEEMTRTETAARVREQIRIEALQAEQIRLATEEMAAALEAEAGAAKDSAEEEPSE
jgi:dihydropteroate synthase